MKKGYIKSRVRDSTAKPLECGLPGNGKSGATIPVRKKSDRESEKYKFENAIEKLETYRFPDFSDKNPGIRDANDSQRNSQESENPEFWTRTTLRRRYWGKSTHQTQHTKKLSKNEEV